MRDRNQLGPSALILLFVLSTVTVGATALSGIAAAGSGNVDLLATISEDANESDVEMTELPIKRDSGYLIGKHGNNQDIRELSTVAKNDTGPVDTGENDGPKMGGRMPATLYQEQPDEFNVTINATNEPVTEGDTLLVEAIITNTDPILFSIPAATTENLADLDTQDIVLTIDGNQVDSRTVTLAGGASQTVTLTWATGTGDAGDHQARVISEDERSQERRVTVTEPAEFTVELESTTSPVSEGEQLVVTATVRNVGGEAGTRDMPATVLLLAATRPVA